MTNAQKSTDLNNIANYIPSMVNTTIQISKELLEELKQRKLYTKESYEEVIWDALEDSMELSKETLTNIKKAEADVKAGRTISLAEIEKRLNI